MLFLFDRGRSNRDGKLSIHLHTPLYQDLLLVENFCLLFPDGVPELVIGVLQKGINVELRLADLLADMCPWVLQCFPRALIVAFD